MDAGELLAELAARGIEVRAAGEELEIRPREAVPAALLAALRTRKPEVLRCLERARPAVAVAAVTDVVEESNVAVQYLRRRWQVIEERVHMVCITLETPPVPDLLLPISS